MRGLQQWRATAWLAATGAVGESRLFLVDFGLRGLRVVVLLSIWRLIVSSRPEASPLPLNVLLTYTLIAEAFAKPMNIRTPLYDSIWQGSLIGYFLRPVGVVRQFAAEASGNWLVDFVFFSLPLLAIAAVLGIHVAPVSLSAGVLFGFSLMLAVVVGLAIEFAFAALALISDQPIWLVEWVRRTLAGVLSGAVIPLVLLPFELGEAFAWLPFASTAWAPLAIYTGAGDPRTLILTQLVWAIVLWPLTLLLWSRNRERVVAYGG
jgi:ABC-type uncharacterized transport system permease subunit